MKLVLTKDEEDLLFEICQNLVRGFSFQKMFDKPHSFIRRIYSLIMIREMLIIIEPFYKKYKNRLDEEILSRLEDNSMNRVEKCFKLFEMEGYWYSKLRDFLDNNLLIN